ncbi:MAG: type IV toxin-antitoxin system AbiEi family antitoxin domain-containing protein [Candidatus Omnitrophica bacterium]|nr:type IV toxin-antitoxin system AbiEi family antitoxin domain-containing protein [Candidatus Omnitrophota bacterium]
MKKGIAAIFKSASTAFTPQELALLWGISNYDYLKTRIQYYIKKGYLRRICHGVYAKEGVNVDVMEVGNKLRSPSYISFHTVLFREGMIFQSLSAVYLASYCSKTVNNLAGTFIYHKIKEEILFNKEGIEDHGTYCMARKERAFLDTIYIFRDCHIDNLRPLDWDKVGSMLKIYGSGALEKRVKEYEKDARQ